MGNIRGVAPNAMGNTMANTIPSSMSNPINPMNTNTMNMNMGKHTVTHTWNIN